MSRLAIRKGFIFGGILISALALMDFVIIAGVRHSDLEQIGKISQLMQHAIDPEVVMFGASNGEVAFDAESFEKLTGRSAFNMCIDGTTLRQYADLVRELNANSQNNQVVIFALQPLGLSRIDLPTEINRYLAWRNNEYIRANPLYKTTDFSLARWVPFYDFTLYNSTFYKASVDGLFNLAGKPVFSSCLNNGGWRKIDLNWGESGSVGALTDSIDIKTDPEEMKFLEHLLAELQQNKRKAILVIMPAENLAFERCQNYPAYHRQIETLATRTSAGFIDYNEHRIVADKKYFYNYTHLNARGAAVLTQDLAQRLMEEMKAGAN